MVQGKIDHQYFEQRYLLERHDVLAEPQCHRFYEIERIECTDSAIVDNELGEPKRQLWSLRDDHFLPSNQDLGLVLQLRYESGKRDRRHQVGTIEDIILRWLCHQNHKYQLQPNQIRIEIEYANKNIKSYLQN